MLFKIKNFQGLIKLFRLILLSILLIFYPINTYSAELLQIKDVDTILVGEQNRSLYLSLYCIDIHENEKQQAIEILKRNFPRGTKVKIKPYGFNNNRLLAKIFRVNDKVEMTELLNTYNSLDNNCGD